MTTNILDGLEERARASVWPRGGGWVNTTISADAIVFDTPVQLYQFVRLEVLRAISQGQVPTSQFIEDMRSGKEQWPPRLRYTDQFDSTLEPEHDSA